MRLLHHSIILLLCCIGIFSCREPNTIVLPLAAHKLVLSGAAYTINENQVTLSDWLPWHYNHDSIVVTIRDTSGSDGKFSAETYTQETGDWRITDIPPGVYNLTFTREGYGTPKYENVSLRSADISLGLVVLGQIPSYHITSLSVTPTDSIPYFQCTISGAKPYPRFVMFYVNGDSVFDRTKPMPWFYSWIGANDSICSGNVWVVNRTVFPSSGTKLYMTGFAFVPLSTLFNPDPPPLSRPSALNSLGTDSYTTSFIIP
jgi:hypothetical protein